MKDKKFNPFDDSKFLISIEGDEDFGRRMLVEMYPEDLQKLRDEIDIVLDWYKKNSGVAQGA